MIGLIITDEELAEDQRAFQYFNTLRRGTSTKAQRWAAWQRCEDIRRKWRWRAMCAHPIAPSARWSDIENNVPTTWTYSICRSLEPDEVEELFPGALAAFATQCDDLGPTRFIVDTGLCVNSKLKLRLSVPKDPLNINTKHSCVTWMPEVGVWRRYSTGIRTRPTQFENEGIVYQLPRPPQLG